MVTPLRLGSWAAGPQPWSTADVSLVVGINIVVSMLGIPGGPTFVNPLASLRAAKRRGLQLIVIDPRRTETAAMADIHLQVTPGEDPTLLAGMLRVILDEGLADAEFCDRWVGGLDELHRAVRGFDLDHVAERRCGVPADDIVRAARMFAVRPPGLGDVRHRSEHGAARHVDGAPRGVVQRRVRPLPARGRAGAEHDGRARPDRAGGGAEGPGQGAPRPSC